MACLPVGGSESGYSLWVTMFNKLEQYIFYLFLFSIPFQTRKILYFDGWRFNEWTSVSVYFTDMLLLVLLLFWFYDSFLSSTPKLKIKNEKFKIIPILSRILDCKTIGTIKNLKSQFQNPNFYLFLFIIISAISIKNSDNYLISWFQWVKLVEFSVFYWYLSHYAFKKFGLSNSFLVIFLSGIFQAIVAIIQFLKQSNIGLKYLGESVINNDFSGVASFYISDTEKIIRAYGTTPHPNVVAVFLLLSLFAFYYLFLNRDYSVNNYRLLITAYALSLFGLFTTFSRTVILAWLIIFCIQIVARVKNSPRAREIFIVSLFATLLFGSLYFHESISRLTIGGDDQAIELRSFYTKEALRTNISLFGVGYGNFIAWLIRENPFLPAYAYQPVHNIFLLVYSETGILGISTFILFLVFLVKDFIVKTKLQKSHHLSFLLLFASFIFIGFFDHMFWTLQPGRLTFWFSLGYINSQLLTDYQS